MRKDSFQDWAEAVIGGAFALFPFFLLAFVLVTK